MNKILCTLTFFVFGIQSLFSNVVEVDNYHQLVDKLKDANAEALVVFDIDNTLIYSEQSLLQPRGKRILEELKEKYKHLPSGKSNYYYSLISAKDTFQPINEDSARFVRDLKSKGVKVIALTAILTGNVGVLPSVEEWRLNHLKEMGFDFSDAFPNHTSIDFHDLKQKEFTPTFKKGMLASAHTPKGEVLAAFLDKLDWKPKHIYFADDSIEHVKSVNEVMEKKGIPVTSIHYRESESWPTDVDEEMIRFQITHLLKNKEWLTDTEAKTVLDKQKETVH